MPGADQPEATPSEWIRVSGAALCRIEHQRRFFLLLNSNRRKKGVYVLSPIGGALCLYEPLRLVEFGAILENQTENELRLALPRHSLPEFSAWFYTGQDRERSPFRELHEELVLESRLLPALTPDDVDCQYLWTVEEETLTDRQGQTGLLTHYFLEIYDIKFKTSAALGPLLVAPPDSGAAWVSADQIARCATLSLPVDGALRDVHVRAELVLHPPEEREA